MNVCRPPLCRTPPWIGFVLTWLMGTVVSLQAFAYAPGVGLGVAAGLSYVPNKLAHGEIQRQSHDSFAWGFFVDIPLLETFYISPAAMLYTLDFGHGKQPVTDIDLNFKLIAPLGPLQLGAGLTGGFSSTLLETNYLGHVGVLGYLSCNVVSNLDVFALMQYKRILWNENGIDDLHGYLGGMIHL